VQIAVISDLHLGRKDKLDQFHRNPGAEAQLYKLLKYLENHVDRIVLLGDVFETLRGKTPSQQNELKEVLKAYPLMAKKLESKKYTLIHGNHDAVAGQVLKAPQMIKIKQGNTTAVFFHGHQLDPIVESFWTKNFEKMGVWFGGWMERAGLDVTKKMNLSSKLKSLNNQWKAGKFEKAAIALGNQLKADIIVTGHSHHPMRVELDNHLFLNSGTRVAARQDLVILDLENNDHKVYKKFTADSQNI